MATLLPNGKQQFSSAAGPMVGGKVYTYDAGTLVPRATYADAAGTVPNTNPVVLDARGEAVVFWVGAYKVALYSAAGDLIWTVDNVLDAGAALSLSLAGPDGSTLVGFIQSGTGAQARTEQDKSRDRVDLLDFIPVVQRAAISSRTSAYDCTAALVNAVAVGKRVIISMPGRYKFSTAYSGTTDFDVEALCEGVEFDLSSVAGIVLKNSGSITQIEELSLTITKGRSIATFASPPSLAVDDWFCVFNPTDYSYSGWRDYYKAGEWKQVRSISGNVVTTTAPFCADYLAADVDIYRMASVKSRLANVKLLGGATPTQLCLFALCAFPEFDRVSFDTEASSAIGFDRCVHGTVTAPVGRNTGVVTGTQYGFVNGNSQHTRVYGGDIYSTRHAIANGGGTDLCCVPVRDFRCYDAILRSDPENSTGAADMHGNIEDSSYERCVIYGAANISGGGNCWYRNCEIHAPSGEVAVDAIGWVAYFREVLGGEMGFEDCRFFTTRNPQVSAGRGLIDIGGNTTTAVTDLTTRPFTCVVRNCSLNGRNLSSTTSVVIFRNRGCTTTTDFVIEGLLLDVDAMGQILFSSNVSGTAAANRIVVDNITGAPSGTPLHNASDAAYRDFPHRLQRQSGSTIFTTVINTTTINPAVNIPLPLVYPRSPVAHVSISPDGTGSQSMVDGVVATARVYQLTTSNIRPMVQTIPASTALATALSNAATAASGTPALATALNAAAAAETARGKFVAGGVTCKVNWATEIAEC